LGQVRNLMILFGLAFLLLNQSVIFTAFADPIIVVYPITGGVSMWHALNVRVIGETSNNPISVNVDNLSNTEPSVPLTLTETVPGSGMFVGNIYIDSIPPGSGATKIKADVGHQIQVSYTSVGGASIISDIVTVAAGGGSPEITGTRQSFDEKFYNNPQVCQDTDLDGNNDDDGDALCDNWEVDNVVRLNFDADGDGQIDLYEYFCLTDPLTPFPRPCNKDTPDIFVELDWMQGHYPDLDAIERVVDAFENAGINLHIQVDATFAILHDNTIPFPGYETGDPNVEGFDQIKGDKFGTDDEKERYPGTWDKDDPHRILKHQAFHYGLFVHSRLWYGTQSGVGEIDGNDFMVSLGSFSGYVGSTDQQAGTLMHELGHNLGLNHGGSEFDITNHKPNYFSVMSYSWQFADYDPKRRLDYSSAVLGNAQDPPNTIGFLNETNLIENPKGLDSYRDNTDRVIYSCGGGNQAALYYKAGGWVNWYCDLEMVTVPVQSNINNLPSAPNSLNNERLDGYNDWASLDYDFSDSSDYMDGVHINEVNGNQRGIAGGSIPSWPGKPPAGIAEPPAPKIPGTPGAPSDPGFRYRSMVDEMTLEGVTAARIAHLLALYYEIGKIPDAAFGPLDVSLQEESTEPKIINIQYITPVQSTPKPDVLPESSMESSKNNVLKPFPKNLTTKESLLWSVEQAIDQINHHDIETTKAIVETIDVLLEKSLDSDNYEKLSIVTESLTGTYDKALDFKKTDIHFADHEPVSEPIIPIAEVQQMIQKVDESLHPTCTPPKIGTPPNCVCPPNYVEAGESCIPAPQTENIWWIVDIIAYIIFIGLIIAAWIFSRRR